MKQLKSNKNIRIMTEKEFMKFMENRVLYHPQCGWVEVWQDKLWRKEGNTYLPYCFTLPKSIKLKHYGGSGYNKRCLDVYTKTGGLIYTKNYFFQVKLGKNGKYYIKKPKRDRVEW